MKEQWVLSGPVIEKARLFHDHNKVSRELPYIVYNGRCCRCGKEIPIEVAEELANKYYERYNM